MREVPLEKAVTVYRGNGKWFQRRNAAYYAIAKSLVAARFPRWLDDIHTDLEQADGTGGRMGDVFAAAESPPIRDWQARRARMFDLLYRTKTPAIMQRARKAGVDIVGADNDRWLLHAFELAVEHRGIILLGWGAHIEPERQRQIAELLAATGATGMCLGTNGNGTPTHELYIPYARELVPWVCP